MRLLSIAVVVIVVVSGCSTTATAVKSHTLTVQEVVQMVHHRDEQIKTLKGEGNITFESPEESHSGSFEVFVKKPDSLRLEIKGPFGIHIGTLTLSEKEYLYYDWRNNIARRGSASGAPFSSLIRLALHADEIIRAFTGEFLRAGAEDSLQTFLIQDDLYVLRYRTDLETREYRIDSDAMSVASYRLLDSAGKANLISTASRFDDRGAAIMPQLLRVIDPRQRRSITIAYSDITLNKPVQCSFVPPREAEIIDR